MGILLRISLYLLFFMTMDLSFAEGSIAAKKANAKPPLEIDFDALQKKIDSVNDIKNLGEAEKLKILELYQTIEKNLADIEWFHRAKNHNNEIFKQANSEIKALEKELVRLEQQKPDDKIRTFDTLSITELEDLYKAGNEKLKAVDKQIERIETEIFKLKNRPDLIREEKQKAEQKLAVTQQKVSNIQVVSTSKMEIEAYQLSLKTLVSVKQAELKALDAEYEAIPIKTTQLKKELQILELKKQRQVSLVTQQQDFLTELQEQEKQKAEAKQIQLKSELESRPLVIQAVIKENITYSNDLNKTTEAIQKYQKKITQTERQIKLIEADHKSAEKKIVLAGLSPDLGRILREQHRNLSKQLMITEQSEWLQEEISTTSLKQFEIENKYKDLSDIKLLLNDLLSKQGETGLSEEQQKNLQLELKQLLFSQKEIISRLSDAYLNFLRVLGDYDFARQKNYSKALGFSNYLDEHLLWVPSSTALNKRFLSELHISLRWFLSPTNWVMTLTDLNKTALRKPFISLLGLLGLLFLFTSKLWVQKYLDKINEKVSQFYRDRFSYTLQTIGLILVRAAPLPFLIFVLGRLLSGGYTNYNFSRAVGEGLQSASIPLFFLQFFLCVFAPEGLAAKHLLWKKVSTSLMHRFISVARWIAIPILFIIGMTNSIHVERHGDTLGRMALIVGMLLMSYLFYRLVHPKEGLIKSLISEHPKSWLTRLSFVWYPGIVFAPLIILGFAAAGYYLSALELQQKLVITLRIVFSAIIVRELAVRWLNLINRKLALQNVLKKREAAELKATQESQKPEELAAKINEEILDIPKIKNQTLALLNLGMAIMLLLGVWVTWQDILPAFSFMDDIVLWQHVVTIDSQDVLKPVTLTNLILALLSVFFSYIAINNFPGVMEILVYQRFSMECGSRYAANQIVTYILIAIAVIFVSSELGGSWSKIQWLAAALSVGLGFGLQEIFANLVSGIILLFERPIRVGDTVTVGGVTGNVSRIQMRATTITDWDKKELIIPNKTFITDQLVNWTLTDSVTRIAIQIGIAYGSDVALAHKLISDIVLAAPEVLKDPEPKVYFHGFGESSLDFTIYVFINDLNIRHQLKHDLHVQINQVFTDNNIVIPFPQRDLHIHSETL